MTACSVLPSKLSDLLLTAVNDAEALESTRGYELRMDSWVVVDHFRDPGAKRRICSVCLAGACMVGTLGLRREITKSRRYFNYTPTDATREGLISSADEERLYTINAMRKGAFFSAQTAGFGTDLTPLEATAIATAIATARALVVDAFNAVNGRAPWSIYRLAASVLAKAGL